MAITKVDILTRYEIALHFKVHENTIANWEKKGMPVIRIGLLRRYDLEDVNKWISLNNYYKGEQHEN